MSMQTTESGTPDTHRFVKNLVSAGFSERQAEALAEEQMILLNSSLVTKTELLLVRKDMETMRKDMATKADILLVRKDMEAMREDMATKADLERLRGDMMKTMLYVTGVQIAATVTLVVGLLKL